MNKEDKNLWSEFCEHRKKETQSCPDDIILSAYIDGSLTEADIDHVESHLSECDTCLDIVSQIQLSSGSVPDSPLLVESPTECNRESWPRPLPHYTELNRKIFDRIMQPRKMIFTIPFMRITAIAASVIVIISVTMIMLSDNPEKNFTADEKIARVIELYNNNKYYQVTENSIDGFAPSDKYCAEAQHNSHKADTNRDGRISMNEVLRYIAKYSPASKSVVCDR